jgi:hypothetical protein
VSSPSGAASTPVPRSRLTTHPRPTTHRTPVAHRVPATNARGLARALSLPAVIGAASSPAPSHRDRTLVLFAFLALGVLMIASLTLLRLLRRLEGNWYRGSGT